MSNTADHVGRAQTIDALGKRWTISRIDRGMVMKFLDYAKTHIPDPRQVAAEFLKVIPIEDVASRTAIVEKALAESLDYLSVTSPRVQAFSDSPEGMSYQLYLALLPSHPEITVDMAQLILLEIGERAFLEATDRAQGTMPQKKTNPGETTSSPNGLSRELLGPLSTAP